ncbi:MAG: hypothetical protein JO112_19445 [Planctomycetes bacterium]|nr:hypothetical protein [Planctomycetota bacterium]
MARARWGIGVAGMILLAVGGCTVPDYFGLNFMQKTGPGGDRVVAGSVETVAQSTQSTLRSLGLSAVMTRDSGAIKISSQTALGDKFTLVLTSAKTSQGEQTRVRIQWDNRSDEQTGSQILGQVEIQSRQQTTGAQK